MRKKGRGLVKKEAMTVTAEAILSHPAFLGMKNRLDEVHAMLQNLPAAIGAAVAEATRQPPKGASGAPVPLVAPQEIEIGRGKLTLDGKTFELPAAAPDKPRKIVKPSAKPEDFEPIEVPGKPVSQDIIDNRR